MKNLKSIFILFICLLVGALFRRVINFPIPDVVYGMLVLFLLLVFKIVKVDQVDDFSDKLLENLAFLFLPLGVSLMSQLDVLGENILPILVACLISCFITMGVTAKVVELVQKYRRGK